MLVWLTLPFYDFCGFRSVAVNSVYKLQFFYIHNVSHCSQRRTEPWSRLTCTDNLVEFGRVVLKYASGQTNIQIR